MRRWERERERERESRLGYKAVPAEQGQLSWSQTGLQPKSRKGNAGKQGCVLKSRHCILGTHACTRPGLWCIWLINSRSLFEPLDGIQKRWWCLTRAFAKSALGQSNMTCILHIVPVALRADSELVRNSAVVAGAAQYSSCDQSAWVWREHVRNGQGYFVVGMKVEMVWWHVSDHPASQSDSQWALQNVW